jgi:small conductance mechanosensitive channel
MKEFFQANWPIFGTAVLIFIATVVLATLFSRGMKRFITQSSTALDNDPTNYQFLRRAITVTIYLVGLSLTVYSIPHLKTLAQSLLAGAGIAAVAIGFASQAALSNVVAGIFIVIFKPFRVNDRITVQGTMTGIVEDITLRHTVIRNFENQRVILPNSKISDDVIINADLVETKVVKWINIGISYDADIDRAKAIMAEEVVKHPLWIDNRSEEAIAAGEPKVPVRVLSLGDFSVNLRAWAWTQNSADGFVLTCDLTESIKKRFDAEGIEIPFPYRTLVYKNPPVG